ncbi:MAG: hypothetical protein WB445_08630 [Acinetobacter sp.]
MLAKNHSRLSAEKIPQSFKPVRNLLREQKAEQSADKRCDKNDPHRAGMAVNNIRPCNGNHNAEENAPSRIIKSLY